MLVNKNVEILKHMCSKADVDMLKCWDVENVAVGAVENVAMLRESAYLGTERGTYHITIRRQRFLGQKCTKLSPDPPFVARLSPKTKDIISPRPRDRFVEPTVENTIAPPP